MAKRRSVGPGVSFFAFQDIITAVVGIFILITLILVLELAQRVEAANSGQSVDAAPIFAAVLALEDEVQRLRAEVERRSAADASSAGLNAFNRQEQIDQLLGKLAAAVTQISQLEAQQRRLETELVKAVTRHERLLSEATKLEPLRTDAERLGQLAKQAESRVSRLAGSDAPLYRDEAKDGRYLVLVTFSGTRVELRDALTRHVESMQGRDRLENLRRWLAATDLGRRQLLVLIEPGGAADFSSMQDDLVDSGATFGYSVVGRDHAVQLAFELEQAP